jgi:peroxiredoxin
MKILLVIGFLFKCITVGAQNDVIKLVNVDKRQLDFENSIAYIKNNIHTFKSVQLLSFYFNDLPFEIAQGYFKQLNPVYSDTREYQKIKERIRLAEVAPVGSSIENFTFHTYPDARTSLKSICEKHTLVLIDFWASSCILCRENSPALRFLYQKFKECGFGILGISTDKRETNWIKAIKQDQTQMWYHGIDDPFKSIQTKLGIEWTPTYVLLNSNMTIIARFTGSWKGLADLDKFLQQYFEEHTK